MGERTRLALRHAGKSNLHAAESEPVQPAREHAKRVHRSADFAELDNTHARLDNIERSDCKRAQCTPYVVRTHRRWHAGEAQHGSNTIHNRTLVRCGFAIVGAQRARRQLDAWAVCRIH